VVVPTYNERENITALVREILAQGDQIDAWVVDDGSPDRTGDAVRALMAESPGRVDLIDRGEKGGRGAAVLFAFKKGLKEPSYRIFFEMDADFSHHPREIPKFLEKLETCDMVIGSRYIEGGGTSEWGLLRPFLSWAANKYIGLVAGVPIRDTTSGYRGYRREVLEETAFDRIRIRGYAVHGEMAYQAWINGFRLGEVPIHFRNRDREASKLSGEEIYSALFNFALLRPRYGFRPKKRPHERIPQRETAGTESEGAHLKSR
jgi:dolichol-phosphate mannosyltransferase